MHNRPMMATREPKGSHMVEQLTIMTDSATRVLAWSNSIDLVVAILDLDLNLIKQGKVHGG